MWFFDVQYLNTNTNTNLNTNKQLNIAFKPPTLGSQETGERTKSLLILTKYEA